MDGRTNLFQKIEGSLNQGEQRIWFHCSSLGEFEQGRPLIETLKKQHPHYKIVLTFFSPSGYEIRKDYEQADYVFYLPMDGAGNATRFIELIQPSMAVFVKYEFWYHYLHTLEKKNIPAILVSAAFREGQPFFRWYGSLFKKMLRCFDYLFVQDQHSKELLSGIGLNENVIISGDTRYDRVWEIAQAAKEFPLIEQWKGKHKLLIAGSTWQDDEQILKELFSDVPNDWKMIIAPHEIDKNHIEQIQNLFEGNSILYSQLENENTEQRVLIIDNIGMLSGLFRYGELSFIGGGFQQGGIHNTLEPAVFGLPVMFGHVYEKFVEAVQLVQHGFGYPVHNAEECKKLFFELIKDEDALREKQNALRSYMDENRGASETIMKVITKEFISLH